jgi:hypothetical protein
MLLVGLLVTLAQAPGAPLAGPGDRPQRRARACLAVDIASPQDPTASPQAPTFSAARIIDLRITAVVRATPGRGVLRFKVFTPGGFLYQSLAAPFVVAQAVGHGVLLRSQFVDGFPQPVREQEALPASTRDSMTYLVTASLPVAGTLITTNGLYGRWTVEPWLEGASVPCGVPKAFVIGP